MKYPKYAHSFEVVATLPDPIRSLRKLAFNFRWTWDQETSQMFREIDRALWDELEQNPIAMINSLGTERLERLAQDPLFLAKLSHCESELDAYLESDTWFDKKFPGARDTTCIAYFCAEFGIATCLAIYSGGLGLLAGDHLKAASDLGLPLVGVGLLYSRGYFRQRLSPDGWQQEEYSDNDFYGLPLQLVRAADEQPLRIEVELPDRTITCQVWKATVGRVPLYLLDSNVLENAPHDQNITDTLYGGDEEMRIRQEIILGIGGMRALAALGIQPTVCHLNEGHAAFLTLERLRKYMADTGCDFKTARQVVVAGNVFTTHTPVPAGFDIFHPEMLHRYIGKAIAHLGLDEDEFVKMGRIDPENDSEAFNMAILAMENSNYVNGVSQLHSQVSRNMFHARWPDFPENEVPVEAITNGIHTGSWIGRRMCDLLDRYLGVEWRTDPSDPGVWRALSDVPDTELWEVREDQRGDFVRFCRRKVASQQSSKGGAALDLAESGSTLDPRLLTVGFARRFATYKRANLLFSDLARLRAMIRHPERPIQFVFAGKAHPRDDGGKGLIQEIVRFIATEGGRDRVVFLENYDITVAQALVQGVDVWLNNPRRPMEASGTSGMKVVPNGGLNCSVLDGWWAEAYQPGLGWAIGDEQIHSDAGYQDWLDSRSLYQVLEHEIAPKFYHRSESGVPQAWLEMIRSSLRELAPRFSTARMVREYCSRFYMPANVAFTALDRDGQQLAKEALEWRKKVRAAWKDVSIASVTDSSASVNPLGASFDITARVKLGSLSPSDVVVQAVVGKVGPNRELVQSDVVELDLRSCDGPLAEFGGAVKCNSPGHRGYVVRVVPHRENIRVMHELPIICWQSGA